MTALQFEVKKDGFTQLQSGSYKLTVTLNPADLDDNTESLLLDFVKAPMGSRYMLALAEIKEDGAGDASQPPVSAPEEKKARRHFKDLPRSQQAGMACQDRAFQEWMADTFNFICDYDEDKIADLLRHELGIRSRAVLDNDALIHGLDWDNLYTRFEQDTSRVPEMR